MSMVSVVPNETGEEASKRKKKDDPNEGIRQRSNATARRYWQAVRDFNSSGLVDPEEKTDDELYSEFKSSRIGRLFHQWLFFVEKYDLSLFHLEVFFYCLFLVIFSFRE